MNDADAAPSQAVMTTARPVAGAPIELDIPCVGCGYDLRGLQSDGRCPECGLSIERSLHGDWLGVADRDWIDTVRLGIALGMPYLLVYLAFLLVGGKDASITEAPMRASMLLALWLLAIGAIWLMTSKEPYPAPAERVCSLRWLIRFFLVVCLLAQLGPDGSMEFHTGVGPVQLELEQSGALIALIAVWVVAMPFYLRRIARRVPDHGLVNRLTRIGRLGALCMVIPPILLLAASWVRPSSTLAPIIVLPALLVGWPGMIMLCTAYLLALRTLRRRLKEIVASGPSRDVSGAAT